MTGPDPTLVATTILSRLQDGWNAADGARYGAPFADESDFVTVRGEHVRGAQAIAAGHQGIFDTIYRDSTVALDVDHAQQVAAGVVVAVVSSTLDVPSGPLQGRHHARMTLTLVEDTGSWRVAALHNTLVAAAA